MTGAAWLVRHGETEWSMTGRHTGHTDVGLTATGKQHARHLGRQLLHHRFALVLSSPMGRALETARLAGFGDRVEVEPDLGEWDYGAYEGISTAEIRMTVPGLDDLDPSCSGWRNHRGRRHPRRPGHRAHPDDGRRRPRLRARPLFSECWLLAGSVSDRRSDRRLALGTATLSVLGWERETPVIERWNVLMGRPLDR